MIKFDLPIDGVKVATLGGLQNHFTTEVIEHFRSGLLTRWLRARGFDSELASVEALKSGDNEATTLAQLCHIFGVEAENDAIAAAIAEATGIRGIRPDTAAQENAIEAIRTATQVLTHLTSGEVPQQNPVLALSRGEATPISDDEAAAIDKAVDAIGVLLPPIADMTAIVALDELREPLVALLNMDDISREVKERGMPLAGALVAALTAIGYRNADESGDA